MSVAGMEDYRRWSLVAVIVPELRVGKYMREDGELEVEKVGNACHREVKKTAVPGSGYKAEPESGSRLPS